MRKTKNSLIGKTVMSGKGIPIGVIKKSLVDATSGKITSLLVKPSHKIDSKEYKQNRQGEIVLSVDCISPVQDVIVFENNPCL
jgi:sporulation protein YlmC with PRC-barrel domain